MNLAYLFYSHLCFVCYTCLCVCVWIIIIIKNNDHQYRTTIWLATMAINIIYNRKRQKKKIVIEFDDDQPFSHYSHQYTIYIDNGTYYKFLTITHTHTHTHSQLYRDSFVHIISMLMEKYNNNKKKKILCYRSDQWSK